MKRIIGGMTYNTDTSTIVGRYFNWSDDEGLKYNTEVYQTRGGAFFRVDTYIEDGEKKHKFRKTTLASIQQQMLAPCNFEIIDSAAIPEPPEATAEPDEGATLYVRVPALLKARIEDAAREAGLSANSWAMRCLERCAGQMLVGSIEGAQK